MDPQPGKKDRRAATFRRIRWIKVPDNANNTAIIPVVQMATTGV
jgi:hypothetical protein